MSTSHRSSHSTRSPIPPAWRKATFPRAGAVSSVSFVIAEPEQGAQLAPATSRLPISRRASKSSLIEPHRGRMVDADTASIHESSLKQDDISSSGPPDASCTPIEPHSMTNDTVPEALPEVQVSEQQNSDTSQLPYQDGNAETGSLKIPGNNTLISSPSSSPIRRGWFSSFGQTKERGTTIEYIETLQDTTTPDPPELQAPPGGIAFPTVASQEDVTPKAAPAPIPIDPPKTEALPATEIASAPQVIPVQRRSWFFSSTSTPSASPRPGASPTSPSPLSTNSITSSLDEEVPKLSLTESPPHTPSDVVPSDDASEGTVRSRLNSLNPSTSRFTIRIPLLGRQKVPLEQAVSQVEDQVVPDYRKDSEPSIASEPSVEPTVAVSSPPNGSALSSATEQPQQVNTPTEESAPATSNMNVDSPSSWWSYIGWGSSKAIDSDESKSVIVRTSADLTEDTSTPESEPPQADATVVDVSKNSLSGPSTDASATLALPVEEYSRDRTDSVMSSESHTSWLTPWAWYSSASSISSGLDQKSAEETGIKTASEIVKEEALTREVEADSVPEEPPKPSPDLSSRTVDINPIEDSISTYQSTWAYLFSTKGLTTKRITQAPEVERDEHGAEIMEIDDLDSIKESDTIRTVDAPLSINKDTSNGSAPAAQKKPNPKVVTPRSNSPQNSPKKNASAPTLIISETVKQEAKPTAIVPKRKAPPAPAASAASSKKKNTSNIPPSPRTPPPNLVLPSWNDTFHIPPRSIVPPSPSTKLSKTVKYMTGVLFSKDTGETGSMKSRGKGKEFEQFGKSLPRALDIVEAKAPRDVLRGCRRAVIIGIHGWFPGAIMRSVLGEPTGTSSKFASMMLQALEEFQQIHKVKLDKITSIPLEGEGTIEKRVEKLYGNFMDNKEWVDEVHAADVIFVATHSQGSVVSTHLLDRLIRDKHIRTSRNIVETLASGISIPQPQPQRVCCLALCGIHLGPLRYLSTSSLIQPYFQYFESSAARELFEFQNTESDVSKSYVKALGNVMNHGIKMVYVASLNDQVVPIYSGVFTAASHPLILRALYIDGDAYHSSDFLSNLLVLLMRVLNTGVSDSGLLAHLSEATAGSLNGVGHSTAYEELATYMLAVKYLFLTDDGNGEHPELVVEPFNASTEQNDYEIPWALRDLIADPRVAHFFSQDIVTLRDAFREWHPKTTILRDVKKKLQPIQKLPAALKSQASISKL